MSALLGFWSRETAAGFVLRFTIIGGLLLGLYAFPFELFGVEQRWLTWYLEGYAKLAGGLLGLFEEGVSVSGNVIEGRFPLQIVRTCDAAEVCLLFTSAVLAFPGHLKQKAVALVIGLSWLVGANLLRICTLYYVGVLRPAWFKAAHEEVWPLLLVMFAAFVFLRSVRYLQAPGANLEATGT
jgi:exosortase/archaeosortase family protein